MCIKMIMRKEWDVSDLNLFKYCLQRRYHFEMTICYYTTSSSECNSKRRCTNKQEVLRIVWYGFNRIYTRRKARKACSVLDFHLIADSKSIMLINVLMGSEDFVEKQIYQIWKHCFCLLISFCKCTIFSYTHLKWKK